MHIKNAGGRAWSGFSWQWSGSNAEQCDHSIEPPQIPYKGQNFLNNWLLVPRKGLFPL